MSSKTWQEYGFDLEQEHLAPLLALPGSQLISRQELLEQWQQLQDGLPASKDATAGEVDADDDDDDDWEEDDIYDEPQLQAVLVVPASSRVDSALLKRLSDAGISTLWVQGDAHWTAGFSYGRCIHVSGDVLAERIALDASYPYLQVLGQIRCQYLMEYSAEDDGMTRTPHGYRISAPYAFFWFVKLKPPLQLSPDAVVFLLSDWDYSLKLSRACAQPLLIWHECVYALRDDLYGVPEQEWHDAPEWKVDAIHQALARGESIWRAGFDPAALAPWRQGKAYAKAGEPRLAWLAQRQALQLAPGFAPAACALGQLMYQQGALAQALPYLQQAHALFPKRQTAIEDSSAYYLALCLLYLGHSDEARQVAEHEIARASTDEAAQWSRRSLAEIALVQGDLDIAQTALEALAQGGLAHNASVLWLQGLWHFRKAQPAADQSAHSTEKKPGLVQRLLGGKSASRQSTAGDQADHRHHSQLARELLAKAIARNAAFDLPYENHGTLRAMVKPDTALDWEQSDNGDDIGAKERLRVQAKLVASEAENIAQIPAAERDLPLLQALIAHSPANASQWLPAFAPELLQQLQPEQAAALVQANAEVLAHLPEQLITHALCMQARPAKYEAPDWRRQRFAAQAVPEPVWDEALALLALACGANAEDLPERVITEAVAQAMVQLHAYDISHVPVALHTDELWAAAVAWSSGSYFLENHVPWRLAHSPQFRRQVIALRVQALDNIPGKWFDADLLEHAQSLYGQRSDWADIVSHHQLPWLLENNKDLAEHWWRAFWTEADILQSIKQQDDGLRPYDIDHGSYTQAIVDACIRQHGLTWLASYPERFVSDALYEDLVRNDQRELQHVPLARRSAKLCALALSDGLSHTGLVPASQVLACSSILLEGFAHGSAQSARDAQALAAACAWVAAQESQPPAAASGDVNRALVNDDQDDSDETDEDEDEDEDDDQDGQEQADSPSIADKLQRAHWLLLRSQGWLIACTNTSASLVNPAIALQAAQQDAQWVLSATQGLPIALRSSPANHLGSETETTHSINAAHSAPQSVLAQQLLQLHRNACFWLGYALWLQGDADTRTKARQLLAASGQAQITDYASFQPASLQAQGDLDLDAFGHAQAMADQATSAEQCWASALEAQTLLEQSASSDALLWAYVLDKKRWASLELGWLQENQQACEDMLRRVNPVGLWAFVNADRAQASMLGAAHHRLGARLLDEGFSDALDSAALLQALYQALRHHEQARELFVSDAAAGADMEGYWDSRLRLLQWLTRVDTEHAAHWQARLQREVQRVRALRGHRRWYWSDEGEALIAK